MSRSDFPDVLLQRLRRAKHITVLTGAGISAESGIPTFREAQTGLWSRYDPQDLATPDAFRRNPRLVWEWYQWRRSLVSSAEPNKGHRAIAHLQILVPCLTVITQNVDGLHQAAGSDSVIELHGNLRLNRCFRENHQVPSGEEVDSEDAQGPPRCPLCQSLLRPDVVWFGEALPALAIEAAYKAAQNCDVFLSIGTSALVHPAASLPYVAMAQGAFTVEINPSNTPLSGDVDHILRYNAGDVLPLLLEAAWPHDDAQS